MYIYTMPRLLVADVVKCLHNESKRQTELAKGAGGDILYRESHDSIAAELDNLAQELADSLAIVVVAPRND